MFVSELLFALIFAIAITLFFSYGFKNRGPWGNIWIFFVVIFLGIWAASRWVEPFGPTYMGTAWMPLLLIGLLVGLLLASSVPVKGYHQKKREAEEAETPPSTDKLSLAAFGMFFWILVTALLMVIAFGYLAN